jgi:hypothetical protein
MARTLTAEVAGAGITAALGAALLSALMAGPADTRHLADRGDAEPDAPGTTGTYHPEDQRLVVSGGFAGRTFYFDVDAGRTATLPAPVVRNAEPEAWLAGFVAIGGTVHVFAAPDGSPACWLGCPVEADAAAGMLHEIHATHPLRPRIGQAARALHLAGALPI